MTPEQTATPPDAVQTPEQSFDDKLLAKFGLGETEEAAPEPEATPAEGDEAIDPEAEADIVEEEAPADLAELEIKHNGELKRVPKDEAVRLAQMGYDYEHKMQRLNGDAQRLQSMAQALKAQSVLQPQFLDALAEVKSYERQLAAYANVNWAEKAEQDPIGAFNLRMAHDQLRDAYGAARYKAEQIHGQVQQTEQHYSAEHMAAENEKLLGRIPQWKDDAVRSKETSAIRESMTKHYGFAPEEIGGPVLNDHRVMAILRDAQKYREAVAAKKGPPKGLPAVAKPGAKPVPRSSNQQLGDIKRGLRQVQSKDARRALEDELIARKFGLK